MDVNAKLTTLRGLLHDHHIGRPRIFDDVDRELVEASERELLALTDEIYNEGLGPLAAGLEGWGAWIVARSPIDALRPLLLRLARFRADKGDGALVAYASEAQVLGPMIVEMHKALGDRGLGHLAVTLDGWASWRADGLEGLFGLPWQNARPDLPLGAMIKIIEPMIRAPWKMSPMGCGVFFNYDGPQPSRYYITAQNTACDYRSLGNAPWTISRQGYEALEPEVIAALHSAEGVALFLEAHRAWRASLEAVPLPL